MLFSKAERAIKRQYKDATSVRFSCAYLYPGMNKVQQAAGRVIRTVADKGAILLLDDRFAGNQYASLFPKEWYPYETVSSQTMPGYLEEFWNRKNGQE